MPSSLHKKYLKAYLVFQDQDFPKTHALEDLVLLAAVKDPGCRHLFTIASELSPRNPVSGFNIPHSAGCPRIGSIGRYNQDVCTEYDEGNRIRQTSIVNKKILKGNGKENRLRYSPNIRKVNL